MGVSLLRTSVAGEENDTGFGGDLKVMYSYYLDKFVVDGGVGFDYAYLTGMRPNGFVGTLQTRAVFLELDARYRITPEVSAGPFLSFLTGGD